MDHIPAPYLTTEEPPRTPSRVEAVLRHALVASISANHADSDSEPSTLTAQLHRLADMIDGTGLDEADILRLRRGVHAIQGQLDTMRRILFAWGRA